MASPESMAGRGETCPACRNVALVPHANPPPMAAVRNRGPKVKAIGTQGRNHLAYAIAVVLVLAFAAWLLMRADFWKFGGPVLSTKAQDALVAGDAQRAKDLLAWKRLESLAAREPLTKAEMNEARKIVVDLESRYGELGITFSD